MSLVFPIGLAAGKPPVAEGERLYRAKCASCHRLLPPEEHSDEEWREYVDKYGKKLTDEEKGKILAFLLRRVGADF